MAQTSRSSKGRLNFDEVYAGASERRARPGVPCYICACIHPEDKDTIDRLLATKLPLSALVKQIKAAGVDVSSHQLRNHRDNAHRERYAKTEAVRG